MNVETREALLFVQREMSKDVTKKRERRDVLENELREVNAEIAELERRINAVDADLR